MTIQLSAAVRDAMSDAIETVMGASPKLQLRTGAPPANCAAADTGTLLVEITLPSDWAAASSGGVKTYNTPFGSTAVATGTIGHYRVKNNAGSVCHEQGTAAMSAADLTVNAAAASSIGQTINVTAWSKTAGNA